MRGGVTKPYISRRITPKRKFILCHTRARRSDAEGIVYSGLKEKKSILSKQGKGKKKRKRRALAARRKAGDVPWKVGVGL